MISFGNVLTYYKSRSKSIFKIYEMGLGSMEPSLFLRITSLGSVASIFNEELCQKNINKMGAAFAHDGLVIFRSTTDGYLR